MKKRDVIKLKLGFKLLEDIDYLGVIINHIEEEKEGAIVSIKGVINLGYALSNVAVDAILESLKRLKEQKEIEFKNL